MMVAGKCELAQASSLEEAMARCGGVVIKPQICVLSISSTTEKSGSA